MTKSNKPREKPRTLDVPTVEITDNTPGVSQAQYNNTNVRGSSSTTRKVINFTVPLGEALGNYDITSSDIGFIPTMINIKGYLDGSNRSWCDITMDGDRNSGLYTVGTSPRFLNNRAVNLFDTASNRFQANFVEFIDGGLRVDITNNAYTSIVELSVTAYK